MAAYKKLPELPNDEALVLAAEKGDLEEVRRLTLGYKVSRLQDVTVARGKQVSVGNQNVSSDLMNPLHLAVYNKHLEVVKELVRNVPFNMLLAGKVPSRSGLANDSEVTLEAIVVEGDEALMGSVQQAEGGKMAKEPPAGCEKPRSLLLFWAIEQENV